LALFALHRTSTLAKNAIFTGGVKTSGFSCLENTEEWKTGKMLDLAPIIPQKDKKVKTCFIQMDWHSHNFGKCIVLGICHGEEQNPLQCGSKPFRNAYDWAGNLHAFCRSHYEQASE
jgi:hypothetical protein